MANWKICNLYIFDIYTCIYIKPVSSFKVATGVCACAPSLFLLFNNMNFKPKKTTTREIVYTINYMMCYANYIEIEKSHALDEENDIVDHNLWWWYFFLLLHCIRLARNGTPSVNQNTISIWILIKNDVYQHCNLISESHSNSSNKWSVTNVWWISFYFVH